MAIGLGTGLTVLDPELIYEEDSGSLDYIHVTVIYHFEPVTPLIANFFGEDGYIDLKSEARQLIEVEHICPGA
jgi:hypothetical protein